MFVLHTGIRNWLARLFRSRHDVTRSKADGEQLTPHALQEHGPLFSLGDTKQDVVVSFRGGEANK
ncbi:MAG: hypothetical protein KJO54_03055 [Gammaproteobacteria bacterium]|nr:hypothetical protein [Gammaproteobacteria bacterium]NNF61681.1 hypothetical protein [Gammaproteobacteria bacterium]NNM20311.1 hypothetical protein [Gammaproteobacteria bacterium]